MQHEIRTISRPLVRTNQWFIVISVLAAWITGIEGILCLPLFAGILGLLFHYNPIMKVAKLFLKKQPEEYIQEDWDQQQFNQVIAVICLLLAVISYIFQFTLLGHIFSAMVALAAFFAIMGFCIGCFIRFKWKQYQYRRTTKH